MNNRVLPSTLESTLRAIREMRGVQQHFIVLDMHDKLSEPQRVLMLDMTEFFHRVRNIIGRQ